MELATLVTAVASILTPALPYLLMKVTEKGAEKVGEKIGEATWDLAQKIWEKLSPKVRSKSMKDVLKDVATDPDDTLTQSAFEYNLRKILSENISLAKELEGIVTNAPANILSQGKNITNVVGTVIDGQIVTGDKMIIQHGDYSTIVEKAQVVNVGNSPNQAREIRPVKINLQLPNGKYPTFRYIDRAGLKEIMLHQSDKVIKKWWDPPEYDWERINRILMEEVNKWTAQGWEVIESDLSKLWITEYGSRESIGTALMSMVGIPGAITWEHWVIHYRAEFHVRRVTGGRYPHAFQQQLPKENPVYMCEKCKLPYKTEKGLKEHIEKWHK